MELFPAFRNSVMSSSSILGLFAAVVLCMLNPVWGVKSRGTFDGNLWKLSPGSSPLARLLLSSRFQDDYNRLPLRPVRSFDDNFSETGSLERRFPMLQTLKRSGADLQDNSYAQRIPFSGLEKKWYRYSREDLFKRSSLNELIRRLMAMNGGNFNTGRATTIRFGVGGK